MYREFVLLSAEAKAAEKKIILTFNYDIDEDSIQNDSITVSTNTGDIIPIKLTVRGEKIDIDLIEWPLVNTEYNVVVEKEIKNIANDELNASVRKKIVFKSIITETVKIISPYQFEKIDTLKIDFSETGKINSYFIEIAKENRFYNIVYSGEIYNTNTISPIIDLENGQYYTRIRVQKDDKFGQWSPIITFIYKNVCDCNNEKDNFPSADSKLPSAWEDLFVENPNNAINDLKKMEELEILTEPENGTTNESFVFEFNKTLDKSEKIDILVIRRDF